jgi:hypothetical protein
MGNRSFETFACMHNTIDEVRTAIQEEKGYIHIPDMKKTV